MPKLIKLNTFIDTRGHLTVLEKIIPFEIKRIFYIYNVNESQRGFHRHHTTIQAAISISGKCDIICKSKIGGTTTKFELNSPDMCLIIYPEDYHWMEKFSHDCVLLVLASNYFDQKDYIFENYK